MRRNVLLIGLLVLTLTLVGCLGGGDTKYILQVDIEGQGVVHKNPDKALYDKGDVVKLVAEPAEGYSFAGWVGGGLSGNNQEVEVVITQNTKVTARFAGSADAPAAGTGTVIGYVSDGQGGPAVVGAQVSWNNYTATTDADGRFQLMIPADQMADLIVERPDGGTTRVQDVELENGQVWKLDIPTRQSFNPADSQNPPRIKLNVEPEEILTGIVDLKVEVEGDLDTYVLYVYVGGEQRAPREGMVIEANELELTLDTTYLQNGATYIRVLAYDHNENTVIYIVPVTIFNQSPWTSTLPGVVPWLEIYADTYAENIGYYSKSTILEQQRQQGRRGMADLNAVPADSMLIVEINWDAASNAEGYKVYRSFDAKNYSQIATIPSTYGSGGFFQAMDYSPQLTPGVRTFYKVVPYNSLGDGNPTVIDVTPLPPMDIYLVSPGNGDSDVELDPTFTWELKRADQFPEDTSYQYVYTLFDATYWKVAEFVVGDAVETKAGFQLDPGTVYSWDIAHSLAQRICTIGPSGVSAAYSWGGLVYGDTNTGSRNGEFVFTTTTDLEQ